MVLSSAANNRAARPSPTKNNAPVLSNGIKAVSTSSSSSLGEQRDTKRAKDITDLQRRLSHLTSAIDDTLQRGGGEKRAAASPAPMRPPSSTSTPAVVVEADSRKPSAAPAPSTTIDTIPTTRVFSLVSRSTSSASTTNYSRGASATAQQQQNSNNVAASTEASARPRSPQQRRRLMSPDLIHSSGRGEMAPLEALSAPVTTASIPSHHHHDHVDALLDDEPVALARTAKPHHNNNNPPPPRTQLVLEDPLPALRDEESDIRLRIAALKRIEAEKMELIAHQKRLIELDNERHRLEDERRRGRTSRGRSGSLLSSAASPAAGAMLSLSPQPQRSVHHNNEAFGTDDEVDREMIAVDHQELRSTHQLTTTTVRAVTPPRSATAPSSNTGAGASSSLSSVFRYHTSRSPSPILRFQSASPSSQAREESTHRVLRNAIAASSNHGGGGLLNNSGQHLPSTTSGGGGPRWIPTAKGDQRFVCRELLVERGIDAKVLTGHDRAIPCKVHLSPNHQELLALPVDETGGLMTESHHFPLRGAALLYPNGVIQHTWIPRRVHVSGVVVGNRAKSVLLAKGCPHFISNARENRPRLYLVVGGDAYSDEATLLVLQFGSRLEWLCVLLGLHGAMWPDGKPPLTPGRALWLYACHAVTQLQWEANTTSDNLWHQSRRRSRSADPHQGLSRNNTPHHQQQQPQQALFHRSSTPPPQPRGESLSTPMNTSHRFAVPPTPTASISPLRPTAVSSGATHHPLQHVTLSSNTSDARSTLAAPSQLSRVYPSSANRPIVGLQATQMMMQQQQQQPSGVGRGPNPAAAPLATLPNGFVLVGSSSSNASSFQQPHRMVSQQQQQQQQQPSVPGTSAPRSTFFPKSLSRQSGGRQSVLQYGY
uniref:Uncharacterized protein n=1 Tax=Bodo saltans TaxID=75058 RepID=B6DTF9_BODSA|nr:hypothetical protein [Bodo saltans]